MSRLRSSDRAASIESAFEASFDLKAITALDGSVLDANRAALAIAQLEYEVLLGRMYWDTPGLVAHPDIAVWLRNAVVSAGSERVQRRDVCLRRADGTEVHYDLSVRSIAPTSRSSQFLLIQGRDITERLHAEEAARAEVAAAEARFRTVLDAGLDAFVIVRADREDDGTIRDFMIVDANTRAARMAAIPAAELSGAPLLTAFPHSSHTGLWENCCTVVATRRPMESTQYAPLPDKPGRWVLRQFVPIDDGVAISSRDITARHLERVELEASEARHRVLFESNGAIQLLADAEDARIVDVNPAAEAFYGWPRETMRSMLATDLESSTLEEWRARSDTIAVGTGHRHLREHRVAGNQRRHVDTFTSLVQIAGRRVVHVIIQDVSDRVRAEALAHESEARYRAVIVSMREGIVVHDHTGAIRSVNPSAERILGLAEARLLGVEPRADNWEAMHDDGSPWPNELHPALVALRTGANQPPAIMGVRRGDGVFTWLSVSAAPLTRAGETQPYGAVAVFSDITDERVSEDRMRQAQKLEAVGQLAGGIAHDFNNLLTVIRGAVGFLAEGLADDSPHLEDVQAIERATVRAEELTRRLLAVGRRQMLQRTRIDLNELLHENQVAARNSVPASIAVRLELSREPAVALLDRTRLHDAIRALVENATNAMPDGGTLTLGTEVVTRDRPTESGIEPNVRRYVVLRVSDSGVGMPDEVKARLFEPFFSTQPFGQGRGMELASVHGMVAQSNGFIECDSEPGSGTTLRLFFPEAAQGSSEVVLPAKVRASTMSHGILLVDDDPMLRDLARRMLEKIGHRVVVAASGADALAVLDSRRDEITVIVTDLTMPGMSGIELIDEAQRRGAALPIVAMSGYALNPTVRDDLAIRQIPFVPKPFTAVELTHAIDRAMPTTAR